MNYAFNCDGDDMKVSRHSSQASTKIASDLHQMSYAPLITIQAQLVQDLLSLQKSLADGSTNLDSDQRLQLKDAAKAVFLALEDPVDMTTRVLVQQPVEEVTVRLAADLRIYEQIATASTAQQPMTFASVASIIDPASKDQDKNIEAIEAFRARLLRALIAFGSIKVDSSDGLSVAPSASLLADPAFASCFGKCQDMLHVSFASLPDLLSDNGYAAPSDPLHTGLQRAYGMDGKSIFDILMSRPATAGAFGQLMNTWGAHGSLLHDIYPVEERLGTGFDESVSDVLMVDVGGGWGQKSIAVKRAMPHLPGRLVSQDLPHIIEPAPKTTECEITAHDFFTPQPVKHPRCFYIRQTLHNWPDGECVRILGNLRDAMKPGYTKLLLHEQIVPPRRASTWTVTQDFNMMTLLATAERTEHEWRAIVEKAALKVKKVWTADDPSAESVVECVLEE